MTLDQVPIRDIVLIMQDSKNLHLLGQPTLVDNRVLWNVLQQDYQDRNPSDEVKVLMNEHKRVLLETIEHNKNVCLLNMLMDYDGDIAEFFEIAELPKKEGYGEALDYLRKKVDKSNQRIEILAARLKKLESEINEQKTKDPLKKLTIKQLNKSLASMEMNGATIPDYNTVTYGQYEAWNELLMDKMRKNAS